MRFFPFYLKTLYKAKGLLLWPMDFSQTIIQWYNGNKRDLPWRNTTDPFVIWLSEIILQQTRVDQGMPYFYRFAEKYPTVSHFAAASEDEVLSLWQGLGYYSRGRNMLKTARLVQQQYKGVFPHKYSDLISLKGIGEYTAAAISSFAANEAQAVVDGNVNRVLARYFGIDEPINSTKGKKQFQQLADNLLDRQYPGMHNQAIMEFGALQCKPKNPACNICPLRETCFAYSNNLTNSLPVKLKKNSIKNRYFNYFLIADGENVLLNKRGDTDIWANMYDLPLIETPTQVTPAQLFPSGQTTTLFQTALALLKAYPVKKHILTHQHIYISFYQVSVSRDELKLQPTWFFTTPDDLKALALPKPILMFLAAFIGQ